MNDQAKTDGAIARAIDAARERAEADPRQRIELTVLPLVGMDPEARLEIVGAPRPVAVVMVAMPQLGAWQPIALEPGSQWVLQPASRASRLVGLDGKPLS